MIPSVRDDLQNDFEIETVRFPSKTYKLIDDKNRCIGFTDEREAIKQAIFLMLSIERYDYVIYSWNYGVELKDLFGQPTDYVASEVKRRIREALLQDDRINEVDSFVVTTNKNKVHVSFTAHTIFGEIQAEKEVAI
ncbi:DUF2634 domain-containing protein [Schinkia azotoformans]|uniref:DUF2634 domain-containing protein n=1 Tax=Schinkia azotoformans TaxID=1454 RepID=UPI002DBDD82E|nr:DUF2634 domain-containing protein [Schinkia azotoformans]MEC1716597.1 DUF2634 domain-containing protein [Schinkia azotoformans]MEC1739435.1 DUF2634 domain-containing protein [Schinkia azotoformans]MEC1745495.1 DUF2634 domain-containing protein [Schinkia azotoformans]MEC1756558.1 DUF2634 domain-containing protein [Schinkia azotoformans]MEC1765825.1 DUF2634 domain-containing protein [Schinkia azotoformans]